MNVLVGTKQFKMILDEEFVERLRVVAKKTGRDSAQHLAEEVLSIYLPVYVAVSEATKRAVMYQTNAMRPEKRYGVTATTAQMAPVVRGIEEGSVEGTTKREDRKMIAGEVKPKKRKAG